MTSLLDALHEATQGRPFVLVVMAYEDAKTHVPKRQTVLKLMRDVVEHEFNVACVRADDLLRSGEDLRWKIHQLIDRALLIVADVSEPRPNVFYELGYAVGRDKTPVLMVEKEKASRKHIKLPYDLQGLEVLEYQDSMDGAEIFRQQLIGHLRSRLKPEIPLLREMLAPSEPQPSFIVASPKYPGKTSRIKGQVFDRRTFGDHIAMLGLISAFGLFYGNAKSLELISAQHSPPDLLDHDINLFLIGSEKTNPHSGQLLAAFCRGQGCGWQFNPRPGWKKGKNGDWPVGLFRVDAKGRQEKHGQLTRVGRGDVWTSDYGLIVRGPHPKHRNRVAMILAGPHSLGTAAASLAATRVSLIAKIKAALPDHVLADKRRTFWVLVKGVSNPKDFHLDEDGVSIEDVGVFS
jgi:hypothetical protein